MNPVPEGKRLRYRLTAVGGYRDVVELKRLQDVKVNAKAKVARMRFIKPCQIELTSRQHFPRCMLDSLYIQQVGKYSFFNMAFSKSENAAFSSKCIQLFTV